MNRTRLDEYKSSLGWKPAPPATAEKPYAVVRQNGDVVYVSGHIAVSGGKLMYQGRIGNDLTIEEAKRSAALCAVNSLDLFDEAFGLERLDKVLKMTGYLRCTEDFCDQPSVMNAASQVLVDVLGEDGLHARSAIGVHSLPLGASVEVEMIVKLKL